VEILCLFVAAVSYRFFHRDFSMGGEGKMKGEKIFYSLWGDFQRKWLYLQHLIVS